MKGANVKTLQNMLFSEKNKYDTFKTSLFCTEDRSPTFYDFKLALNTFNFCSKGIMNITYLYNLALCPNNFSSSSSPVLTSTRSGKGIMGLKSTSGS